MLERAYGIDLLPPLPAAPIEREALEKELAGVAPIADRREELLAFDSAEARSAAIALLGRLGIGAEPCELRRLPRSAAFERKPAYEDYAIEATSGRVYFDASLIAAFRLTKAKPEAEPAPALLQLEEHEICALTLPGGETLHLIDRQLAPLADRIARAYGCFAEWFD